MNEGWPNATVSVIDGDNDIQISVIPIAGEIGDTSIAVDNYANRIYVVNTGNNTVSVINGTNNKKQPYDIAVGTNPTSIAASNSKTYVVNTGNDTVSVINGTNNKKYPNDIAVGEVPTNIAVNPVTNMIYVVNTNSGTVTVIDGFSDKVAAGVTLNTHPANAGTIMCDKKEYPTNIYLYVDAGTSCTVQPNKGFEFIGENLNQNSTIPLGDSSGNLTVNRYGNFYS